jgi:hypothetical protein
MVEPLRSPQHQPSRLIWFAGLAWLMIALPSAVFAVSVFVPIVVLGTGWIAVALVPSFVVMVAGFLVPVLLAWGQFKSRPMSARIGAVYGFGLAIVVGVASWSVVVPIPLLVAGSLSAIAALKS